MEESFGFGDVSDVIRFAAWNGFGVIRLSGGSPVPYLELHLSFISVCIADEEDMMLPVCPDFFLLFFRQQSRIDYQKRSVNFREIVDSCHGVTVHTVCQKIIKDVGSQTVAGFQVILQFRFHDLIAPKQGDTFHRRGFRRESQIRLLKDLAPFIGFDIGGKADLKSLKTSFRFSFPVIEIEIAVREDFPFKKCRRMPQA